MQEQLFVEFTPFIVGLILSLYILSRARLFSSLGIFFKRVEDYEEGSKGDALIEVGGIMILPIILIALCPALGLPKWLGYDAISASEIEKSGLRIFQVIAGCAFMYIVGVKNDMHGAYFRTKFLALLAVSFMFPISNLWINDLQGLFGIYEISPWIGMPITVAIVMYITTSVAILDDVDGIGVGMTTIISFIYFGFCIVYDFILGAMVSSALLGISTSYTCLKMFNKKWKKTVVGNAGSYTFGYILAYLTLSLTQQSSRSMPCGIIMIVAGVMLVPLLDVIRTVRSRVREGRAMLTPDRNQMHHQFIRMGISNKIAPMLVTLIILGFATLNTLWVTYELNLTLLCLTDIALWFAMQAVINYRIHICESNKNHEAWQMEYGPEAWESNTPVEVIRRKQRNFGSMGLPSEVILGKELDFIHDGMNSFERNSKRLFDMISSGVMIVLTSPLFLLSYVLIKISDGGTAIYAQERIGRFGRPFRIYKFRSMRLDAEKFGPALSHAGGEDDPRLTKVGKFLRAHHLDELPQLWNVFCGDMSFIGYRPERQFFIDQIIEHDPRYSMLYQIRPGVTSYATLYNGYTDTMEKMLRRLNYDLYYLEHRSFWFDLRILWLTFISIIFGKKF